MKGRLLRRLQVLFQRRDLDRDIDAEMRFHLEMEAAELVRLGMPPDEARRRALVAFGGEDRMRQRGRDAYGVRWLEELIQDARQGARLMMRAPAFSATAVLTLALGIGATTAIFSVVDAALLKPLPYPRADRLVSVWGRFEPESGFEFSTFPLSLPEYVDYQAQTRALEHIAAYDGFSATLVRSDGTGEPIRGAAVTANLFDVLNVHSVLGRTHTPGETVTSDVVVLSHAVWHRSFGGDPSVVGRAIRVDGRTVEVIGIMPAGFAFPDGNTELWTPLTIPASQGADRTSHFLRAVGRLADDADVDHARAEMHALMQQWKAAYPDVHTGHFLFLRPLLEDVVGDARLTLLTLLSMVGFVLLIVCANVVNLLLARGRARQRELAVRSALGASRVRLVRQFVVEGAILSLIAALAGLAIAWLAVDLALTLGADSIPRADAVAVDRRALLLSMAVASFTTAVFALAPALSLCVRSPHGMFGEESRSATAGAGSLRLRQALVAAQVALAVIVVIGAGLTLRSFAELTSRDRGFEADAVFTGSVNLPSGKYSEAGDVVRAYERVLEQLATVPGVRSTATVSALPLGGSASNIDFQIEGVAPPAPGEMAQSGDLIVADPGYASTFGVDVLEGRFFERSDRLSGTSVAVVNRRFARTFWPGESAVGRRIRSSTGSPWLTVVGVVDDVQFRTLADDVRPAWYVPLAQMPLSLTVPIRDFTVAVQATGNPAALAPAVHDAVKLIDPNLTLTDPRTLDGVVAQSVAAQRFATTVLGLFAALALVIGAIGIYGVLAYSVTQRTREFGIRMALGARSGQVAAIVLTQGLRTACLGLFIGLTCALFATRLMGGLLFGVSTFDPATYAAATGMVCVVVLAACSIPVRRAIGVDPVITLRAD